MIRSWTCLLFVASIAAIAQQTGVAPAHAPDVMLAAVSRDDSMLSGGINSGKWTGRGTVYVEPLARLTPSGEWKSLPCTAANQKGCLKFERDYLAIPHTYAVVSAGGRGTTIHAAPAKLSECYDYTGTGTYSGAPIAASAIAASSSETFAESVLPRLLNNEEARAVRKALEALVPRKLDSIQHLRLFTLRLEDKELFVVQRAFSDIAKPERDPLKLIFAIGTMDQGHFHILHWKENTEDENERVLGTISLKSGRAFLITVVNDPEGHWYRVYGIKDGHLKLVYSGGGSGC